MVVCGVRFIEVDVIVLVLIFFFFGVRVGSKMEGVFGGSLNCEMEGFWFF